MKQEQNLEPKYFGTKAAAKYLGFSHKTLEKYRVCGGGPKFFKIGRYARYKLEDLDAWAEVKHCSSTSEYKTIPNYRGC